jgi:hypothetical protein
MSFSLGIPQIALAVAGILLFWKWRSGRVHLRAVLVSLLAMLVITCFMMMQDSDPIWARVKTLQYMAFPWRFLLPASFAISLLAGAAAGLAEERFPRYAKAIAIGAILALVIPNLPHAVPGKYYPNQDENYTPLNIASRGIRVSTLEEYLPLWAAALPVYNPNELQDADGLAHIKLEAREPEKTKCRVITASPSTLKLNRHYYPGWEVTVDGKIVPTTIDQKDGKMFFQVGAPGDHTVEATLKLTGVQRTGRYLSYLSFLILACLPALAKARLPFLSAKAAPPDPTSSSSR